MHLKIFNNKNDGIVTLSRREEIQPTIGFQAQEVHSEAAKKSGKRQFNHCCSEFFHAHCNGWFHMCSSTSYLLALVLKQKDIKTSMKRQLFKLVNTFSPRALQPRLVVC